MFEKRVFVSKILECGGFISAGFALNPQHLLPFFFFFWGGGGLPLNFSLIFLVLVRKCVSNRIWRGISSDSERLEKFKCFSTFGRGYVFPSLVSFTNFPRLDSLPVSLHCDAGCDSSSLFFFFSTFINFAVGTCSNLHDFPPLTLVVYFPAPGSDCNCRLGFSASCYNSWNSLRSISETSVLHLASCSLETQMWKGSKDNRL